jgi:hypothetical protein
MRIRSSALRFTGVAGAPLRGQAVAVAPSDDLLDWFAPYRDLDYRSALELAQSDGRPVRVIRPGGAWQSDLAFERLNIQIDSDEKVVRIWPG